MELWEILRAILTLAFVLGLLLVTLWALKYCQVHFNTNKAFKNLKDKARIDVIERKKIDARNSIVLIKRDNVEHLVLLGQSNNVLIEADIKPEKDKK